MWWEGRIWDYEKLFHNKELDPHGGGLVSLAGCGCCSSSSQNGARPLLSVVPTCPQCCLGGRQGLCLGNSLLPHGSSLLLILILKRQTEFWRTEYLWRGTLLSRWHLEENTGFEDNNSG